MIRPIVKDILFLARTAEKATAADKNTVKDLYDTLFAHSHDCVGLAANMIGAAKAIIAVRNGSAILIMMNPKITKRSPATYETEEGCLSLSGKRPVTRHEWIEVMWEPLKGKPQKKRFSGFTAEIIQHEMDHLEGILI